MKKLLSILGAATIVVSSSATVIACQTEKHDSKKHEEENKNLNYLNSQNNLESALSIKAKELILTDQFQLSRNEFHNQIGKRQLEKELTKLNKKLEKENIKDWNENLTVKQFLDTYLPTFNPNENSISEDINLNGARGASNGQLWAFLKNNLNLDLGDQTQIIESAISILPSLNGGQIESLLVNYLPKLDKILGDLTNNSKTKTIMEATSIIIKELLDNENSQIRMTIQNALNGMDVGNWINAQTKGEAILPAGLINLMDGILMLLNKNPESKNGNLAPKDLENNSDFFKTKISALGNELSRTIIKRLDQKSSSNQATLNNDLENKIKIYSTAIPKILLGLQFIQLHFVQFDNIWAYDISQEPNAYNNLFSSEKTNKEYIHEVLNKPIFENPNIELNENGKIEGSLNFKYLFTVLAKIVQPLTNAQNDAGYSIARLFNILFLSPNEIVDPTVDGSYGDVALSSLIIPLGFNFLGKKVDGIGMVQNIFEKNLSDFIVRFNEALLTGGPLKGSVSNLVSDLINSLDNEKILKLIEMFKPDIAKVIREIIANKTVVNMAVDTVLDFIPLFKAQNGFKSLYLEEPLDLSNLVNIFDNFLIKGIIKKLGWDETKINDIKAKINGFNDLLKNNILTTGATLNLHNLLTTELNNFGSQTNIPWNLGEYYHRQSLVSIINNLTKELKINFQETHKDLEKYDFKMSFITGIWNHLINPDYQERNQPKMNLISWILENPNKTSTILGIEENKTIRKDSLIDYLTHTIWKDNEKDTEDRLMFLGKTINVIFKSLNSPQVNYGDFFDDLFNKDSFEFNFTNLKKATDEIGILEETATITYKNPFNESEWNYTMIVRRNRVEKPFKIVSFAKKIIEK